MSYSPVIGTWMEKDPGGYLGVGDQYQFDDWRPNTTVDPTGKQGRSTTQPATQPATRASIAEMHLISAHAYAPDSGVFFDIHAAFQPPPDATGYFVQHVTVIPHFSECRAAGLKPVPLTAKEDAFKRNWGDNGSYFENISVVKGKFMAGTNSPKPDFTEENDDNWRMPGTAKDGQSGSVEMKAVFKFFKNDDGTALWSLNDPNKVSSSGIWGSSSKAPTGWSDVNGSNRSVTYSFECGGHAKTASLNGANPFIAQNSE